MNILIINHYAGSNSHGMEFRPFYLAKEWVKAGHKVRILAASHSHVRSKQPSLSCHRKEELIEGVEYVWYKTPKYHGNGLFRVINIFYFVWRVLVDARRIAKEFNPDLVIASSTYPMDILPAKRISDLSRSKLVFEVHDLWPLTLIELGRMSKWHPFIVLTQFAEDYAYKCADKVVSILPKALDYMTSRGLDPQKFSHVPNGIDESEWVAPKKLDKVTQLKLNNLRKKELPIVGYVGTIGLANSLDVLLDVAKLLKNKVNVVIVGKGNEESRLMKRISQEQICNVLVLPAIDKKMIPNLLSLIDIAYIGWNSNPMYRFGISPNKLMDYMMSGKPIVHAVEAGNDPVSEAGCGISVAPDNPEAISNAIMAICKMSIKERALMGNLGKKYILNNQTYSKLAIKFLDTI